MIQPKVNKTFTDMLKLVRDDCKLVWNDMIERFQIIHKDKRTGLERIVVTVEDDDGNFTLPDNRAMIKLGNVYWELIDKYPSPTELWGKFLGSREDKKKKQKALREEYRKWWNKDHRSQWRKALENFHKGVVRTPPAENKIIIT